MKRRVIIHIAYVLAFGLIIASCQKPFNPKVTSAITSNLVVEGVINPGSEDSTWFKLSHTVRLDRTTIAPVTGAEVTIEGTDNTTYTLTGNAAGIYVVAPLNLNTAQKYRLHIKTNDNKEYLSDYVPVKITPVIDNVNYSIKSNGVQVSLDTHDPANNTRYYRWDFVETWQFHSKYNSTYISNGDSVIARERGQQVYYCYTNAVSTNVTAGTSVKLTRDVISAAPIIFIPSTSEKLEAEYSIIVNQYALTSDAYNFWENLKKNTESLGSIFDAQPSEIAGNIHCTTNPGEPVIGYVSACTVQSKRIFIDNSALPSDWVAKYPYDCTLDSAFVNKFTGHGYINQENLLFNYLKGGGSEIPVSAINTKKDGMGHTGSSPLCVDCTLRGTTKKPSFFP